MNDVDVSTCINKQISKPGQKRKRKGQKDRTRKDGQSLNMKRWRDEKMKSPES